MLESYSRETCELADFIFIVIFLISITFIIIMYTLRKNIPLLSASAGLNIAYASGALTLMLFLALPVILRYLKIDIISSSRTSSIAEDIALVKRLFKKDVLKSNP